VLNKFWLLLPVTKAFDPTDTSSQQTLPLFTGNKGIRNHRYFFTTNFAFVDWSPRHSTPQILLHYKFLFCLPVTEAFDPTDIFPQDKLRLSTAFSLPHTTLVTVT
jgi:hypothetical protein